MAIRDARPDEREPLEELQRRASLHESPYRDRLLAHPDVIELPTELIARGLVRVVADGDELLGFAVLLAAADGACELDGLFDEPRHWRRGVGRALVADAAGLARARGAARVDVVANPQALEFYRRVGFVERGQAATRFGPAPRMTLELSGHAARSFGA